LDRNGVIPSISIQTISFIVLGWKITSSWPVAVTGRTHDSIRHDNQPTNGLSLLISSRRIIHPAIVPSLETGNTLQLEVILQPKGSDWLVIPEIKVRF
jgi:hypothetical protein